MSNQTAAEVLANCKAKMGDELGEAFHFCRQKLFDLSAIWDQHETLFQNKERIDVLNRAGSFLSYNIQRLFYRDVLLGLMRLLDPIEINRRKNLVLDLLLDLSNERCRASAAAILAPLKEQTKELVAARNKILAHNDYDVSTNKRADLNFGSRVLITNSFRAILKFLNVFEHEYLESQTIIVPMGNHSALQHLHYLDQGLRIRTRIESDVKSGVSDWVEFRRPPDWLLLSENEEERYSC
jgi:hypothetical protein